MSSRLTLALSTGELVLPDAGMLSVLLPAPGVDLQALPRSRTQVVQPFKPYFDHFTRHGYGCVTHSGDPCALAVVCLPRAKAQARATVHDAVARSGGLVVVDGNKSDGIDSIYRDIRRRVTVRGQLTKAHGRIFWFAPEREGFADWKAPRDQRAGGFQTAPGVFSADAVDPASQLLVAALPGRVGRHVVDLGAGWGYLSAEMLKSDTGIERLDLVEADHVALDCARGNVRDVRAHFHWRDVLGWDAGAMVDCVVTNPPFHSGRATDLSLGRGFIATAARVLAPSGNLWMVANRHLPYEAAMNEGFATVQEIAGDNRFKVIRASRPGNPKPDRMKPARSRRARVDR